MLIRSTTMVIGLGSLFISGCANLTTIDRTTKAPVSGKGIAIHLDAEQRVVMVGENGIYCAEPSPDAAAAEAAGFAGGLSVAGDQSSAGSASGAGSGSAALQQSIASLSRRTQSTQLQREVMYRICESYYNGSISRAQAATLLSRSQDLTTVILAVEQLTGAVSADPVALTSNASGFSAATLMAISEHVEAAKKHEETYRTKHEEAESALTQKKADRDKAQTEFERARAAYDTEAAKPVAEQTNLDALETDRNSKEQELVRLNGEVTELEKAAQRTQTDFELATQLRETIEGQLSSALTASGASASGSARFGSSVQASNVNADTVEHIATAVQNIVTTALNKEYTVELCLGLASNPVPAAVGTQKEQVAQNNMSETAFRYCNSVILSSFQRIKQENIDLTQLQ